MTTEIFVLITVSCLQAIQAAHDAVAQEGQCRVNAITDQSQAARVPSVSPWNTYKNLLPELSRRFHLRPIKTN